MFKLLIISSGRNPPTLPEISSFPRNSKKSVTLSSTATLQHRGRGSVKGSDTKLCFKKIRKEEAIYRITFLIKRKKASLEEVQKFRPYIAICW